MTLCVLITRIHMYLIHKVPERDLLTVLVPFPNSSMRTNELPVLLLRAWAIWRIDTKTLCVCVCLNVCYGCRQELCYKNALTGGEWE